MSMVFDRYVPIGSRTFAMRTFNQRETEINEHFWSFKVISDYSGYIARTKKTENPATRTKAVFKAQGPDARRIPPTVSDWLDAQNELENWLRQSAIVSAASYLEAYLSQVVRSALMSDPMARHGARRSVDGVSLLKRGIEIPYETDVESITKGHWSARAAAFARLFGAAPDGFKNNLSDLEKIRKLRNEFAHGFGRELSTPEPSELDNRPSNRLSQERFIKYVDVISKVASSIDRHLLPNHIGAFEIIHFYHGQLKRPTKPEDANYDPVHVAKRCFTRDAGVTVSKSFCRDLIRYYDSI